MLTYDEAVRALLEEIPLPRPVQVPLEEARGRVLSEPIRADLDVPPFTKALMDGYAVLSGDTAAAPCRLRVVGVVAAGAAGRTRIGPGEAAQIMTGAPLPEGADAVQQVEKTRLEGEWVEILESVSPGRHLSPEGSEVKKGAVILSPGRLLGPAEIGVLAAFGCTRVPVYQAPAAAVAATGDEIVNVGDHPAFGQIRNSNTWMLAAQCRALGISAEVLPRARDDPGALLQTLESGLRKDVLLLTGGVSMGAFDYVPGVLEQAGIRVVFHKAAIKPGKPIVIGRKGERMIFGLPGNPVSAFVTFELFVRPALLAWMGSSQRFLPEVQARLLQSVEQKPGRRFYRPARTWWASEGFRTEPVQTLGSGDLSAFSRANSLLVMEADVSRLAAGEMVSVLLFRSVENEAESYR